MFFIIKFIIFILSVYLCTELMKVIFLRYYEDAINGCHTFVNELSSALTVDRNNYDVYVVILGYPSSNIFTTVVDSITYYHIPDCKNKRWVKLVGLMATVIPDNSNNIFLLGFTPSFEISQYIKRIVLCSAHSATCSSYESATTCSTFKF